MASIVGTVFISAQEVNPPETITQDSSFSLKSWFSHTFGIQQFSIVGDSRQCSQTPDYNTIALNGVHYTKSASAYCSSGYGIWDIFSPGWNPYKEYNNNVDVTFGSSGGNVELYCCDHPECSSDSQCQDWVGEYSTCKTASCSSWLGGYKCTTDFGTETNIPYCRSSFKYCSANTHKDCYYVSGSSCIKHTYPGVTSCPSSYQGAALYSSLSTCNSNICTPVTCSSLGKNCGSASNGCGGTLNCGTCDATTSCNSNGYCQSLNTTEVPCSTASIDIIDIPCTTNTLSSCNSVCPTGYIAGTLDSCGFHNCVLIESETEVPIIITPTTEKSFDIMQKIFGIPLLYLIIGFFGLLFLLNMVPKK
ncbi:MAG: hypothetical protein WC758_07805 [Candidatus Woesearchaeota archaeon]